MGVFKYFSSDYIEGCRLYYRIKSLIKNTYRGNYKSKQEAKNMLDDILELINKAEKFNKTASVPIIKTIPFIKRHEILEQRIEEEFSDD